MSESGTFGTCRRTQREVIEPSLSRHDGRLIKTTGDGALAEFASPSAAVRCAVEIQEVLSGVRQVRGAGVFPPTESNTAGVDIARHMPTPRRRRPWHAQKPFAREPGDLQQSPPVAAGTLSGRPEAVADDECDGEVGLPEVARKRANKAPPQPVERRGGAKENAELQSTVRRAANNTLQAVAVNPTLFLPVWGQAWGQINRPFSCPTCACPPRPARDPQRRRRGDRSRLDRPSARRLGMGY
jgi:hypothetical protein